MTFRSGFVGIIGRPNVGKSTLVNRLVGQKVAIVSDKPQTTRTRIHGVVTRPDGQVVLVDTPGIHVPKHRLGEYMVRVARDVIRDVDAIWFLRDATRPDHPGDEAIARSLAERAVPLFIVWNKMDRLRAEGGEKPEAAAGLDESIVFSDLAGVHYVSALEGEGVEALLDATLQRLPEGPQYYPSDWVTDNPEQFVAAELIREKVLELTREEIPHSVAIDIEAFSEREDRPLVDIHATIYVERDSQKGIIIGKGGRMLKAIGEQARADMEHWLGRQVNLQLWVKVKPDWREKEGALQQFGYR